MRIASFAGALALLGLGCAGGFPSEEVPADPIAYVRQAAKQGIVDLESFQRALSLKGPGTGEKPVRTARTTLSLLTVPTGEIREVPEAGLGSLPLDWSPDGLRLLIARREHPQRPLRLFAWNRMTETYKRLTPSSSLGGAALGNGQLRLALVGRVLRTGLPATRGIRIYTGGEGDQPLPGASEGIDPDIAPDGRTVIFVRPSELTHRDPRILAVEIASGKSRLIGRGSQARFSRDGAWIVFVRHRSGNADVWLMRQDGSGKRPVARSSFDEEFPALSPGGKYVVYASARGDEQASQLFLTRVEDGVEIQLTHSGQNSRPVW